jgi:hypothetical protein
MKVGQNSNFVAGFIGVLWIPEVVGKTQNCITVMLYERTNEEQGG